MDLKDVPAQGRAHTRGRHPRRRASGPLRPRRRPREEVKRMNGMRKAIARNMQNSHMTSPTVTFNLGCDVTELAKAPRAAQGR